MGPSFLFILVLATAAPLLSADQWSLSAIPPRKWLMFNPSYNTDSSMCCIIIRSLQTQASNSISLAFAAGFSCATSTTPCDMFLFAVSIVHVYEGTDIPYGDPQVVWSANRDHPVGANGTLELTLDGNLVLRDADGSHVWSSGSSGRSVACMMITDIGNLVLLDQRNETVWQSFDHPTDTLLLGQSLLEGRRLTSNTSATNSTESQLYITILERGLYAYVESTPSQLYYYYPMRQNKIGSYPTKVTLMNGTLSMFGNQSDLGTDGSILLPKDNYTQYMRLDSDGHLRLYGLLDDEWTAAYDVMKFTGMHDCDYPTVCGEYGICTGGQCACPLEYNSSSSYFRPVDERKPNLGCTAITPISCQEIQHHQLLTLPNTSYFDKNYTVVNARNIDDCKQACLKNCSCKAVVFIHWDQNGAYDNTFNGAYNECQWVTKILSMESVQPKVVGQYSTTYLKVQLVPSIYPSNSKKKR
ncbi:unnamed protein product [Alopecurus aequalis]